MLRRGGCEHQQRVPVVVDGGVDGGVKGEALDGGVVVFQGCELQWLEPLSVLASIAVPWVGRRTLAVSWPSTATDISAVRSWRYLVSMSLPRSMAA